MTYELIDLGDDRFTVGRPHPMIDPRDRATRIEAAATNPEIGKQLHLSKHTVKEHSSAVYRKLGVRNRTEAVQVVMQRGLVG